MNSYYHSKSSASKWGSSWEAYKELHDFLDHTKAHVADMRHRALLHSSWGIYMAERVFGELWTVPGMHGDKEIPTRLILERHCMEDLGKIPSVQDYLTHMTTQPWMAGANKVNPNPKGKVTPLPTLQEVAQRMGITLD